MSTGQLSRSSKHSAASRWTPPPVARTPDNDLDFAPCAATASFLLYAQRNQVLVVHHDTLAIDRRFDLHHEDVVWIAVDNTSERGTGRLAVSYDKGNTAIVWDILTGGEVARFSAYERMLVASFLRDGTIAFGNEQGNIILFDPATSEHLSARTIFDPVTALAPSSDCTTFAIGYMNGSILIATLQPSFTILHTLTTTRAPSKITGLAWHGSSSKQKTDMLATQTLDGDLRVWSVPKVPHQEAPNIIRVLQRAEYQPPGPCWFAWSKSGRIVQHCEGETRAWDVRTKKVTYDPIPTVSDVASIAIYGPSATLFTLGRNHTVHQYDISPNSTPMQVASAQHVPANTPPTPPTILEELKNPYAAAHNGPRGMLYDAESSADEGAAMSPMQKIAMEMDSLDALESELRDKVGPLSPVSSRASSVSSKSSGASSRRKGRKYLYDRPDSSRASSTTGFEGTEFSFGGPSARPNHESMSIRSVSSYQPRSQQRTSNPRREPVRSSEQPQEPAGMDIFSHTKARLQDVSFRTPHYGQAARTPELLQREMLSVVFGWNDDIRTLIRDELSRHRPGSASAVLLAKWLGDVDADDMASMIGSQTMTSSDWMLLALSSIGADSQKKVGEAFVQRLLESGDVHPAVAILLGLGEHNDAIEVYVSQQYWMEAVLLTCLMFPSDWGRQSWLIRKWGETAVQHGQAELAVRCFSCTSVETSEPWFSPRAQDAVYMAQQARLTDPTSPPLSPPSRSASGRLTAKNASLKLITTFGVRGVPAPGGVDENTPMINAVAATPIAESALSPGGLQPWKNTSKARMMRDPSSARTATPGGYTRRKRLPSRTDIERAKQEAAEMATPLTAARDFRPNDRTRGGRDADTNFSEPQTALKPFLPSIDDHLPSPAPGVFSRLREQSRSRDVRKPDGLAVQVMDTRYTEAASPGPSTGASGSMYSVGTNNTRGGATSPPLTGISTKGRAIDPYISSVDEARSLRRAERAASRQRGESRRRNESRAGRASSRMRDPSQSRNNGEAHYIQPAKRSPSSPVPMTPQDYAPVGRTAPAEPASTDDENFYKLASPVDSHKSLKPARSESRKLRKAPSPERAASRARSRGARGSSDDLRLKSDRGRSKSRKEGSMPRSPSSSSPPLPRDNQVAAGQGEGRVDEQRARFRARSSSRQAGDGLQARRAASRATSKSRRPSGPLEDSDNSAPSMPKDSVLEDTVPELAARPRARVLSKKDVAAKELEARRMSLARRPSAPTIPMPGELSATLRPNMSPRSHTDLGNSPLVFQPPLSRSHTVDPEAMSRYNKTSGPTLPAIGLPATPRAMRHPRYMNADPSEADRAPPVPEIPGNYSELSSLGSLTGSNLSQITGSNLSQNEAPDDLGPLLPSTVFGQKPLHAPPRSASAPPEKSGGASVHPAYKAGLPTSNRRQSIGRGHVRKISPPDAHNVTSTPAQGITSIDEALRYGGQQIMMFPEESDEPITLLPELQHLAGPPPPPPPPTMYSNAGSGVINISIDEHAADTVIDVLPQATFSQTFPQPMDRATTASPSVAAHRRAHGSVSESIGSRFRGVTDRMRSSSRTGVASRAKSPPMPDLGRGASPYETILPHMSGPGHHQHHESITRAKSPYEQEQAAQHNMIPPPPPPPPAPPAPGLEGKIYETAIPPSNLPRSQSAMGGYRNPKEIRANMPPETLQQGVYNAGGFL